MTQSVKFIISTNVEAPTDIVEAFADLVEEAWSNALHKMLEGTRPSPYTELLGLNFRIDDVNKAVQAILEDDTEEMIDLNTSLDNLIAQALTFKYIIKDTHNVRTETKPPIT